MDIYVRPLNSLSDAIDVAKEFAHRGDTQIVGDIEGGVPEGVLVSSAVGLSDVIILIDGPTHRTAGKWISMYNPKVLVHMYTSAFQETMDNLIVYYYENYDAVAVQCPILDAGAPSLSRPLPLPIPERSVGAKRILSAPISQVELRKVVSSLPDGWVLDTVDDDRIMIQWSKKNPLYKEEMQAHIKRQEAIDRWDSAFAEVYGTSESISTLDGSEMDEALRRLAVNF